jgi:hypothetical protein
LYELRDRSSRIDPIVTAVLTAYASLTSGVVVFVSAAADTDLAIRHYVNVEGSAQSDVLTTWRVRPMILAGFGFTAIGDTASLSDAKR